jgi:hypothetical protein
MSIDKIKQELKHVKNGLKTALKNYQIHRKYEEIHITTNDDESGSKKEAQ